MTELKFLASPIFWCVSIPIPNYDNTDNFYQDIFVSTLDRNGPTLEEIKNVLQLLHERDSQYELYLGTWTDCLSALDNIKEGNTFPRLSGRLVHSNTFCTTKWGDASLSVSKMNIAKINREYPGIPIITDELVAEIMHNTFGEDDSVES